MQNTSRYTGPFIPFDTPLALSGPQVSPLLIKQTGASDLAEFNDSRFECRVEQQQNELIFIITRRRFQAQSIPLTCLDNPNPLHFSSFGPDFDKSLAGSQIKILALTKLPSEILGSGCMGQVYQIGTAVLKIQRTDVAIKEGRTFYPIRLQSPHQTKPIPRDSWENHYVSPQPEDRMILSFKRAIAQALPHTALVDSKHYPKCMGVVYVQELNIWGVLSEYIPGIPIPENFESTKKALKIMTSVLQGLKLLDEQGQAYTDLKRDNILIRPEEIAVMIDDIGSCSQDSQRSRQEFGTLLYNALSATNKLRFQGRPSEGWQVENSSHMKAAIGAPLTNLIQECWGSKSIAQFGWKEIAAQLNAISY